jgi:hypothetical protein
MITDVSLAVEAVCGVPEADSWFTPLALAGVALSLTAILLKGASLICFRLNQRRGILNFAAASILLIAAGSGLLFGANKWGDLLNGSSRALPPEVTLDSMPGMSASDKRIYSTKTAQQVFILTGRLTKHFSDGGALQMFQPLSADYEERDKWLATNDQAFCYLALLKLLGVCWIALPIVVFAAVSYVARITRAASPGGSV